MTLNISVVRGDDVEHDLDAYCATGVQDPGGMFSTPAKRGKDLIVPGVHGEVALRDKRYGAANLVLKLWVRGVNPDGTAPATDDAGRLAFHANLRALIELFAVEDQVRLRHRLSDGTVREIAGEVPAVIVRKLSGRGRWTLGQFNIALYCQYPFWRDLDLTTSVVSSATATSTLGEFAGTSAQIEDLVLTFGPQSNPRLEQPSTGVWVAMNRIIGGGQTLVVDTGNWLVYGTGGLSGGLYESLSYGGPGTTRWFALSPEPGGGAPIVSLTETGLGSGSVSVTGLRTYLTT
jgi:hypothetical protein